jgi:Zn-dependent protease
MIFVPFLGAAVIPTNGDIDELDFYQQAQVVIAGPMVNLLITLVGLFFLIISPGNKYALGAIAINVSLMFFNLLPFSPFDGGKIVDAVFESTNEEVDGLIANGIRALALLGGLLLIILGKFNISYLLITLGITLRARKDDPRNAYSERAMNKGQLATILTIYVIMLFGGMLAEVFTPNWVELFNIWPANKIVTTAINSAYGAAIAYLGIRVLRNRFL